MSETAVLTFTREKETKSMVRFEEQVEPGQAPITGKLYVSKHFADGAERLTVTIERHRS